MTGHVTPRNISDPSPPATLAASRQAIRPSLPTTLRQELTTNIVAELRKTFEWEARDSPIPKERGFPGSRDAKASVDSTVLSEKYEGSNLVPARGSSLRFAQNAPSFFPAAQRSTPEETVSAGINSSSQRGKSVPRPVLTSQGDESDDIASKEAQEEAAALGPEPQTRLAKTSLASHKDRVHQSIDESKVEGCAGITVTTTVSTTATEGPLKIATPLPSVGAVASSPDGTTTGLERALVENPPRRPRNRLKKKNPYERELTSQATGGPGGDSLPAPGAKFSGMLSGSRGRGMDVLRGGSRIKDAARRLFSSSPRNNEDGNSLVAAAASPEEHESASDDGSIGRAPNPFLQSRANPSPDQGDTLGGDRRESNIISQQPSREPNPTEALPSTGAVRVDNFTHSERDDVGQTTGFAGWTPTEAGASGQGETGVRRRWCRGRTGPS